MTAPYYVDEAVTIYRAECLEILPALEAVDHVITDPPYEAKAHTYGRQVRINGRGIPKASALDFVAMTPTLRAVVAAEAARLARRWVLVFCQAEAVGIWRAALVDAGLSYRRACVWIKPDAMPQLTGDRPGQGYESIVCAHAPGPSTWNAGGKRGVYEAVRAASHASRHLTEKPEPLLMQLIADFTDPGDLVLDPFGGSGTTAIACKRLGRRCILIERDDRHCATAARRLAQTALELFTPDEAHQTPIAWDLP